MSVISCLVITLFDETPSDWSLKNIHKLIYLCLAWFPNDPREERGLGSIVKKRKMRRWAGKQEWLITCFRKNDQRLESKWRYAQQLEAGGLLIIHNKMIKLYQGYFKCGQYLSWVWTFIETFVLLLERKGFDLKSVWPVLLIWRVRKTAWSIGVSEDGYVLSSCLCYAKLFPWAISCRIEKNSHI